jgi:quercetin dioxygenase-like cupin family protein
MLDPVSLYMPVREWRKARARVWRAPPAERRNMETITRPYALAREEGEALWFLGTPTWVKATSDQTGGALGLVEHVLPAGSESPWHLHHTEDEAFYVVEGEMTFICGDKKIAAGPGAWVWGPRGVPHGFRVEGTSPARLLLFCTPAGFEQFIIEMGVPATDWESPPAGPPDMEQLVNVAARYRIDILGPLPD